MVVKSDTLKRYPIGSGYLRDQQCLVECAVYVARVALSFRGCIGRRLVWGSRPYDVALFGAEQLTCAVTGVSYPARRWQLAV
jgi:hypothetical protein